DDDELVMALTRALADGRTVPRRVLSAMEGCARLRSRALITQVVTAAGNGVESVLEWRFLQQVIRRHGLPEPVLQPVLVAGTRSDAAWTEFRVVVELDGRLGHAEAFRDMDRDNRL